MGTRRKLLESLIPTNFLPRLPSAYQEIEYLESTGTQWIDSGFAPGSTKYIYECRFAFTEILDDETYNRVFGNLISGSRYLVRYQYRKAAGNWVHYPTNLTNPNGIGGTILQVNTFYNLKIAQSKWYIDNNEFSLGNDESGTNNTNIAFFANSVGGNTSKVKIAYFRIKNANGTLVRDFVPCYRKADGVAGLYDIVNGVFYTNAGTGTFICGRPVVSRVYQPVEYIESTGTQYIDTGVAPDSNNLRIQLNAEFTSLPGSDISSFICGSANVGGTYRWNAIFLSRSTDNPITLQYSKNNSVQQGLFTSSLTCNAVYHINNGTITANINGVDFSDTCDNYTANHNSLYLFSRNDSGSPMGLCKAKLYSTKLWKNDVLVRSFVPCYRKSDGEIGLYDIVEGKFYTNSGTGTFLKGQNI